jgi:hypothetical protein
MGRNDSQPINGSWGMLVAFCAWIMPTGVYFFLKAQFGHEAVWPQVGPLLLTAFEVLIVFGQLGALLFAALAWPRKLAKWTVPVAGILFLWHLYALFMAFESLNSAQI